jgi:hypothetical protein
LNPSVSATAATQACCSAESGANDARSHAGTACWARFSSIVAMSNDGSRCTVLMPADASCFSCCVPALSRAKAR